MKNYTSVALILGLWILISDSAYGWLRLHYEDATIVDRSELIVVGRLLPDSIQYVPHDRRPNDGRSHEHHGILVITEVLKGNMDEKEIPIIIHYGLTPEIGEYVDGKYGQKIFRTNRRDGLTDYPNNIIGVLDTGNSLISMLPLVPNASEDNIWFLRRRSGIYGREPGTGNFGIVDPEDLQPLQLKEYFGLYLEPDPESLIKAYAEQRPEIADRVQPFLDHLQVQRAMEIQDERERLQQLLPYYLKRATWNSKSEAKEGILSCGDAAGEYFESHFDDPQLQLFRQDIILMWRDLGYAKVAPKLIEILKQQQQRYEDFLKDLGTNTEEPIEDWNKAPREIKNISGELYYGLAVLAGFQNRNDLEFVRALALWAVAHRFKQTCDAALGAFRDMPDKANLPVIDAIWKEFSTKPWEGNPLSPFDVTRALHSHKFQETVPVLTQLLGNADAGHEARTFLAEIVGEDLGPNAGAWLEWYEQHKVPQRN